MKEAHGHATIAQPRAECWDKLRDLSRADRYVPGLTSCELTTEQREGVGASRRVVHRQSGVMDETVVAWAEDEGFTLRLHRGDRPALPFAEARFEYRLEDTQGGCEIHTTMRYSMAWGPLGALLDLLIVGPAVRRNVQAVAERLARYYEADEAGGS